MNHLKNKRYVLFHVIPLFRILCPEKSLNWIIYFFYLLVPQNSTLNPHAIHHGFNHLSRESFRSVSPSMRSSVCVN